MKKILLYTFAFTFLIFTSCEDELDKRHFNPDGFTDAKIEFLYTAGAAKTIDNDYSDFYSYVFRVLGTYTQTVARKTGTGRGTIYRIQSDLNRWGQYYTNRMLELKEMEKIYEFKLAEDQKAQYAPYMETAKILKAYNTIMITDIMGSIPYSEGWGSRNGLYGQPINLTPKYDTQQEIYYSLMNDLETAASYLKNNSLDNTIEMHRIFPNQDIVFGGDFEKWRKFANSMLLRAAMRISYKDEAKTKEVLSKLSITDLITNNDDNAYTFKPNTALSPVGIWRALRESQNQNNGEYAYAPQNMVKIFNEANDPRLVVYFQPPSDLEGNVKYPDKPIVGYPESADDAEAIIASMNADDIRATYGIVNSVTIRNNSKFPNGIGITASDVYFFLAEAHEKNIISWGNAEEYYNKGIILSIQEYYDYYKNSTETGMKIAETANADVSDATLLDWLSSSTYKYDSSKAIEQIATQRWIHLWILQPFENWAEYRRTDLPLMVDDKEQQTLLNQENAPVRAIYPSQEQTMNNANFQAVKVDNDPNVRVWWDVK